MMMKRLIALFLCLCMALAAVSAVAEPVNINLLAQTNDYEGDVPKYVIGTAALGDVLYILTTTTVERWVPGDAEPTVVFTDFDSPDYLAQEEAVKNDAAGKPGFNKILSDDNAVYGLNRTTGALWKLADTNGALAKPELAVKLAWDTMQRRNVSQDYEYTPQLGEYAILDGVLYLAMVDWETDEQSYELCSWTLATGAVLEDKKDIFVRTLTPYKDGLLLCKYYDEVNSWDEETQTQKMPQLATYNPKTGEVNILMDFTDYNLYAVRYNAATDTVYYVQGATVYRMQGTQSPAAISAYLPNRIWEDASVCIMPQGMIAVADGNGVIVRELDAPGIENGALTVYGEYGSAGHLAYVNQNPQALVTTSEDYFSNLEEFTAAMVSGSSTVDVLRLNSDYSPLTRLIDKGYALDLSAYPELMQIVSAMDPTFTALCMKDGKLYGVPVDVSAYSIGYNEQVWTDLGLTEDDLPTNLMEFLDFIANWQADYGEEHSDLMLMDSGSVKESLLDWIIRINMAYEKSKGEDFAFDTELFRTVMQKFETIDFSELDVAYDEQDDEYWSRTAVFSSYNMVTYPGQYRYDMQYFPLPLTETTDNVIPAQVEYMIINPRSTHIEQAVQYLSVYAQNLDPTYADIVLFPDNNEPVESATYEKDRVSWQETLDESTEALKTAKEEDKASIQDTIDYFTKMLTDADTYRYDVTADEIQTYRELIAPALVVVGGTPFDEWDKNGENEFYTLRDQYNQGAITLDAFIKETDKRLRMMQLEDK